MNIAFLNSIEKETYGGMEEWIRLIADGLVKRGHKVALIGRPDSEFLSRVGGSVQQARTVELNISGDFNPITIGRIKSFLRDDHTQVLIVNFNKDVRLGGIAASGTRIVWSLGSNLTHDGVVHRWLTPRLVDGVIVPSQALGSEVTASGYIPREIVEVIPIGIESGSFSPVNETQKCELRNKYGLPSDATVAVTVGRLIDKKGHEYLVNAAPEILRQHPNVYFLFLGNGSRESVLRRRAAELGLEKHFIFAGMLDNVESDIAGSDLMIHPSKEEPFGIALLEGMRAGLPVAASRVGGIPEVVADGVTARLFEPRNATALAEAVNGMLSDTVAMRQMGQLGRSRWLEHFTVETMVDRVEKYLTRILD